MGKIVNDFSISIATVNGSGSQSANNILMRSLFRMGIPVAGKNIFPSNIAGLPTWFSIRVNEQGFTSRRSLVEVFVAMNPETFSQDIHKVKKDGVFIYNKNRKLDLSELPKDLQAIEIDFNALAGEVTKSIQIKKLLVNMIYVGVLAELLEVSQEILAETVHFQFKGKESVFKVNEQAIERGRRYAQEELKDVNLAYQLEPRDLNRDKVLMDGNAAGALGLVYAGCSFASWYPITPSSSLAESFQKYCHRFRKNEKGGSNFAMVQAEDELSAISMVAGAGWAGCRAMTATSGPGVSLMGECLGLMYFAEIPGVLWNVQRMGPSTGLPTRTSQGDLLACAHSSHGDTRHPVLLPSSPKDCFEMARMAFDLAEEVQTPVFVLTDLDLGMNFWVSDRFLMPEAPLKRGKVLGQKDLEKLESFARYADVDGDGVPYRTLPGTRHDLAAYFTRGTGHTPEAKYSEDSKNYKELLERMTKKWQTIRKKVPKPVVEIEPSAELGLIYYGSTEAVMPELRHRLSEQKITVSVCRVRAFPFTNEVLDFIRSHEKIIVIEQNEMGQMTHLLRAEYPQHAGKIQFSGHYDGMTLDAEQVCAELLEV